MGRPTASLDLALSDKVQIQGQSNVKGLNLVKAMDELDDMLQSKTNKELHIGNSIPTLDCIVEVMPSVHVDMIA